MLWLLRTIILCSGFVMALIALGQSTFEQVYDHSSAELGLSIQQTADGGYIMCGIAWNDSTSANMVLLKADDIGEELWRRTFGTALADAAYCVRQTSDGGFVMCGLFSGFGSDTLTVIRTDPQGELIWQHYYPGNMGRSIGYSVVQTTDGGFAVCGFSEANGDPDAYVIKINESGGLTWSRTVDLGGSEYANCIRQLDDDGYAVLVDNGEMANDGNIHLLRLNSQGDTLWTRTFGTGQTDQARGLWVNDDGGFIIAGGSGYPKRDVFMLRTDAQGNSIWQWAHGDTDLDEVAYDVQQLPNGGFIFGGRKEDGTSGDIGMYLFKTDPWDAIEWEREFLRGNAAEAISLDQTMDGGFALFGHTTQILNENFANTDMYLVKTDVTGLVGVAGIRNVQQTNIYPNPATDQFTVSATPDGIKKLVIMNMVGLVVHEVEMRSLPCYNVQVPGLPNGPYIVKILSMNGIQATHTLIISK